MRVLFKLQEFRSHSYRRLTLQLLNQFVNMYSARRKISKAEDASLTGTEELVTEALFDLEHTNQELQSDLKDLYIDSAA
nr:40s ribosomal protein s7 [Quercus suber]